MYTEDQLISFAMYRNKFSDVSSNDYKNIMEALHDWKEEHKIDYNKCDDTK